MIESSGLSPSKHDTGREGEVPLAVYNMGYRGSAPLLVRLGKHTAGKSCLYIEKLANIDLKVLSELVVQSIAALRSSLTA